MKYFRTLAVAASISIVSLSSWAAFTTSELGGGSFSDGSSVGDILNNLLGTDGAQAITISELTTLASALAGSDSFDYSATPSLALFDVNNDGSISEQEFVDTLSGMASINDIMTSGNGKYAQAYATELGKIVAPITTAKIQAAITAGNAYSVDAPQVNTNSAAFSGLDSAHSASLGLVDGFGKMGDNASLTTTFAASHDVDTMATSRFKVASDGTLQLASGTDIQDLASGIYTISVSTTDNNPSTYALTTTNDVTLTVSNENGCIVNNGIASANFDTNGDTNPISGATVTIDGSHNSNDLLFVRTASKSTSGNVVTYTNFGVSGVTGAYNKATGQLTFTGSTSLANWIETFKKVGYIYDSSGVASSTSRSLIFALSGNVVFNHTDGNSHFYKYVSSSKIHFDVARVAADASTLYGLQGYLATITTAAEQQYIEPKLAGVGWIGGCDRLADSTVQSRCGITSSDLSNLKGVEQVDWTDTAGHWTYGNGESYFYWVTGPERLEYIGEDTLNCSTSNYAERKQETLPISSDSALTNPQASIDTSDSSYGYHNFQGCEPNNWRHAAEGENYLHVYGDGSWNDFRHDDDDIAGYLIEYGGMSGDPSVDLTENKSYNVATEGQFCAY